MLLLLSRFVMSDSVRPHRRQPTRLPRPWDSPGKNTGAGCHFLLQCMKVKNESEVAQSYLILSGPMDFSLPSSSIHGIFQARVLEWLSLPSLVSCNSDKQNKIPVGVITSDLPTFLLHLPLPYKSHLLWTPKTLYLKASFQQIIGGLIERQARDARKTMYLKYFLITMF